MGWLFVFLVTSAQMIWSFILESLDFVAAVALTFQDGRRGSEKDEEEDLLVLLK